MKTASILVAIPVLALVATCPFALAHPGVTGNRSSFYVSRMAESKGSTSATSSAVPFKIVPGPEVPKGREPKQRKRWRPVAEMPPATSTVPKLSIHPIIDVWLSPATITQSGEPTIRIIPARVGTAYGIAAVGAF